MAYIKFPQYSIVIVAILFILNLNVVYVLSSPVPNFVFQPEKINFDKSNDKPTTKILQNDETPDVRRCLDDDNSMPHIDFLTGQVTLKISVRIIDLSPPDQI